MAITMTGMDLLIKSNGLSPLKPAIAIVTPAIGLEERAIPEANWSGGNHECSVQTNFGCDIRNHWSEAEESGVAGAHHEGGTDDDEEHNGEDSVTASLHTGNGVDDFSNTTGLR